MSIPDKMIINRNPSIAKIVLLLLITFLGLGVEAGEPEVYYYAGNDRPALKGVYIVNEFIIDIGKVAVEGFQSLPGKWKPATLNNQAVRCFVTFPINFIYRAGMFEDITFTSRMLFYIYR